MPSEVVRLFSLLRAALSNTAIDLDDFIGIKEVEWQSLFQLSMRQDVTALVCDGVLQLPPQLQPSRSLMLQFLAEQEKTRTSYIHKQHALIKLLHFFNGHHIDTMILKGFALSFCYPTLSHRQFSDLDIYQFGKYKQADALLQKELGIDVHQDAHHHTKYCFQQVTFENHFDFLNCHDHHSNRRYESLLKQQVQQDVKPVALGEEQLFLPSPTFNALFLMRHTTGHFAAGQITVRYLCDWLMFLHRYSSQVDWSLVNQVYHKYNMDKFVAAVQGILEDNLSLVPLPELPRSCDLQLQNRILNDILYGEFSEPEYPTENFGRLLWKIRRFRANTWKHDITYSDPRALVFIQSLFAHLQKPRSIIHKM